MLPPPKKTIRGRIRKYSTRNKGIFRKVLEFAEKRNGLCASFFIPENVRKAAV